MARSVVARGKFLLGLVSQQPGGDLYTHGVGHQPSEQREARVRAGELGEHRSPGAQGRAQVLERRREGRDVLEDLPADDQVELLIWIEGLRDVGYDVLVVGARSRRGELLGFDVKRDPGGRSAGASVGYHPAPTSGPSHRVRAGMNAAVELGLHRLPIALREEPRLDQRELLSRGRTVDRGAHGSLLEGAHGRRPPVRGWVFETSSAGPRPIPTGRRLQGLRPGRNTSPSGP